MLKKIKKLNPLLLLIPVGALLVFVFRRWKQEVQDTIVLATPVERPKPYLLGRVVYCHDCERKSTLDVAYENTNQGLMVCVNCRRDNWSYYEKNLLVGTVEAK